MLAPTETPQEAIEPRPSVRQLIKTEIGHFARTQFSRYNALKSYMKTPGSGERPSGFALIKTEFGRFRKKQRMRYGALKDYVKNPTARPLYPTATLVLACATGVAFGLLAISVGSLYKPAPGTPSLKTKLIRMLPPPPPL